MKAQRDHNGMFVRDVFNSQIRCLPHKISEENVSDITNYASSMGGGRSSCESVLLSCTTAMAGTGWTSLQQIAAVTLCHRRLARHTGTPPVAA